MWHKLRMRGFPFQTLGSGRLFGGAITRIICQDAFRCRAPGGMGSRRDGGFIPQKLYQFRVGKVNVSRRRTVLTATSIGTKGGTPGVCVLLGEYWGGIGLRLSGRFGKSMGTACGVVFVLCHGISGASFAVRGSPGRSRPGGNNWRGVGWTLSSP